jgi:hypothetical protein
MNQERLNCRRRFLADPQRYARDTSGQAPPAGRNAELGKES